MKVIGLTGGVGAGKSTILAMMQQLETCRVIDADKVGHALMEPGERNYRAVLEYYGSGILLPDGSIDRKKLALLAFSSPQETSRLDALTHPGIHDAIAAQICAARKSGCPLLVLECAMIHQAGLLALCDEIWYVHVPAPIRKQRIMQTRGYEESRAEAVIRLQPSEEQYRRMCSWEIQNTCDPSEVRAQIAARLGAERRPDQAGSLRTLRHPLS